LPSEELTRKLRVSRGRDGVLIRLFGKGKVHFFTKKKMIGPTRGTSELGDAKREPRFWGP